MLMCDSIGTHEGWAQGGWPFARLEGNFGSLLVGLLYLSPEKIRIVHSSLHIGHLLD